MTLRFYKKFSFNQLFNSVFLKMDFFTLVGLITFIYFSITGLCLLYSDCNLQLAVAEKFGKKLASLEGSVVWITEASTDLGRRLALKVAQNCGKLALTSNSVKDLKRIRDSCLEISPSLTRSDVLMLRFDIADTRKHRACFEKIVKHFGTIDVVVINEDKWQKSAWERTHLETDRLLFESNVFGVLSLSRMIVRYFSFKEKGKLAITSSIAGLIGVPYSGCYTGSKHALHGYYNSLRIEKLGENIQITLLCTGSNGLSRQKFTKYEGEFLDSRNASKKFRPKRKMMADRCAHLCLTAIVNNLDEAWMGVFPILPLVYGIKYYPNITKYLLNYLVNRETKGWSS